MEEIKKAIIKRLTTAFPAANTYGEQIKQGFKEPCFFVQQIDGAQLRGIDRQYNRTAVFDVHYFPDGASLKAKEECNAMAAQLYDVLEYVRWQDDLFRGLNLRHEVVDDVLHFFINFNVRMRRVVPQPPKMQAMEQIIEMEERLP